jgi:predicted small metal-binding protein
MARKFIDCREYPSEMHCTIAISADDADELVDAAARHAVAVHNHADSAELRATLRSAVKEGSPA